MEADQVDKVVMKGRSTEFHGEQGQHSSPPQWLAKRSGGRGTAPGCSWAQVVQGARRFWWETSKAFEEDITILEEKFS